MDWSMTATPIAEVVLWLMAAAPFDQLMVKNKPEPYA
jgi:hypothetical protein